MEVNHNVFVHFSTHVGTYSWTLGSGWFVELNLAWLFNDGQGIFNGLLIGSDRRGAMRGERI
jgi:hypothetical protein